MHKAWAAQHATEMPTCMAMVCLPSASSASTCECKPATTPTRSDLSASAVLQKNRAEHASRSHLRPGFACAAHLPHTRDREARGGTVRCRARVLQRALRIPHCQPRPRPIGEQQVSAVGGLQIQRLQSTSVHVGAWRGRLHGCWLTNRRRRQETNPHWNMPHGHVLKPPETKRRTTLTHVLL